MTVTTDLQVSENQSEDSHSNSSSKTIKEESEEELPLYKHFCSWLCNFILHNFLALCLILSVTFGAVYPPPGVFLSKLPTSYVAVVCIFLFNGLQLKTEDLKSALKQYKGLLCGLICILALSPIIGAKLTSLLPYDRVSTEKLDPLDDNTTFAPPSYISTILGPGEIKIGFQVYFLMPCTIVTCIVMVTQLEGDVILTMLISISTNILSIFLIPLMLNWLMSFDADVRLDIGQVLLKLVLTVLLPIVVGKVLRIIGPLQRTVDKYKREISLVTVAILCLIPMMTVSNTSASNTLGLISVPGIFICIAWSTFIHILFILLAVLLSLLFRLERKTMKTVIIAGSQKTLVLSMTVIAFLPPEAGDQGLMSIPVIISHMTIVVLDSVMIARVVASQRNRREDISVHGDSKDVNADESLNVMNYVTYV